MILKCMQCIPIFQCCPNIFGQDFMISTVYFKNFARWEWDRDEWINVVLFYSCSFRAIITNVISKPKDQSVITAALLSFPGLKRICLEDGLLTMENAFMRSAMNWKLGQDAACVSTWLLRNQSKDFRDCGGGQMGNVITTNVLGKNYTLKGELIIHKILWLC